MGDSADYRTSMRGANQTIQLLEPLKHKTARAQYLVLGKTANHLRDSLLSLSNASLTDAEAVVTYPWEMSRSGRVLLSGQGGSETRFSQSLLLCSYPVKSTTKKSPSRAKGPSPSLRTMNFTPPSVVNTLKLKRHTVKRRHILT